MRLLSRRRGYLGSEAGVTVHRRSCARLLGAEHSDYLSVSELRRKAVHTARVLDSRVSGPMGAGDKAGGCPKKTSADFSAFCRSTSHQELAQKWSRVAALPKFYRHMPI